MLCFYQTRCFVLDAPFTWPFIFYFARPATISKLSGEFWQTYRIHLNNPILISAYIAKIHHHGGRPLTVAVRLQLYRMANSPNTSPVVRVRRSRPAWVTRSSPAKKSGKKRKLHCTEMCQIENIIYKIVLNKNPLPPAARNRNTFTHTQACPHLLLCTCCLLQSPL